MRTNEDSFPIIQHITELCANYVPDTQNTLNKTKKNAYPHGANILEGAGTKWGRAQEQPVLMTQETQEHTALGPALLSTAYLLKEVSWSFAIDK